jgi:hypothetical protein
MAQAGPRSVNISVDKESGQSDASDSAAPQDLPYNRELSAEAVPLHPLSNEAPSRRPSPSDTMNIRHLLHDNIVHETPLNDQTATCSNRNEALY